MTVAHITVVSVVPAAADMAAPTAPAATAETTAGAPPFAALLGERLGALIEPRGDGPRDESADEAPQEARDDSQSEAAIALLGALPALTEARQWTPVRDQEGSALAAAPATLAAGRLPVLDRAGEREPALTLASADASGSAMASKLAEPMFAESLAAESRAADVARPLLESSAAPVHASLAHTAAPLAATAPAVPVTTAPIATPVYASEWPNAVSERITVFVRDRIHAAELQVNPPELGPVSVRIDVTGNEANLVFGVQQAETRNLLMESLPRLAEALAANGIALTGAQIGAEMPARRDSNDAADGGPQQGPRTDEPAATARPVSRGLVDVFV